MVSSQPVVRQKNTLSICNSTYRGDLTTNKAEVNVNNNNKDETIMNRSENVPLSNIKRGENMLNRPSLGSVNR